MDKSYDEIRMSRERIAKVLAGIVGEANDLERSWKDKNHRWVEITDKRLNALMDAMILLFNHEGELSDVTHG